MLSGILLLNRDESVGVFFKKRLSRLLIPFIFWVAVYVIYSGNFSLSNISNILFGASGTLGVTFWFVWMIILMYVAIFIINRFFSDRLMYILAALSVLYFAIVRMGLFNPYTSRIVYFASFITYIVIGYVIANSDIIGGRLGDKRMAVTTFVVSLGLYLYYIFGFVYPRSQLAGTFVNLGYFNPLILIMSVNIFTFFKYLSKTEVMQRIENSGFGDMILKISQYSFGIYLVHYLVIEILKANFLSHIANPNPFIGIMLTVAATLIIIYLALWILAKIPYLNRFSGVK